MAILDVVKEFWENTVEPKIPPPIAATAMLRGFGLLKVPMLFYVRPSVLEISETKAVVKIPLSRRSQNHLGSMYFGALAVGADAVIGLMALHWIKKLSAKNVQLVFKDFKADFLKRPEGDVYFVCEEGKSVGDLVKQALNSGERVSKAIKAYAYVPSKSEEPVAEFSLTLSLKRK